MNFLKEADGSRIVQKFQSKFKVFLFSELFKQMALAIAFFKIRFVLKSDSLDWYVKKNNTHNTTVFLNTGQ